MICGAGPPNLLKDSAVMDLEMGFTNRLENANRHESYHLIMYFNFESPNQIDSISNIVLLFLVMVLMVAFSLVLSNSVSALVLQPLENVLAQVRKMASRIFHQASMKIRPRSSAFKHHLGDPRNVLDHCSHRLLRHRPTDRKAQEVELAVEVSSTYQRTAPAEN